MEPIPRGPLDPWGSITKYLGDTNVCDSVRKEAIERQIMTIILRSVLPLGFAENPHFQDLVELLCPSYAKCGNAYLGDMLILVIVSSFCYYCFLVLGLTCCFVVVVSGGDASIVVVIVNVNMVVCLLLLLLLMMLMMLLQWLLRVLLLLLVLLLSIFFIDYIIGDASIKQEKLIIRSCFLM